MRDPSMRRPGSRIGLAALLLCCYAATGCAITLQHDPLEPPAQAQSGDLYYQSHAEGLKGRVGWGRGTAFYIPFVPVYIKGDDSYGNEMLMTQLSDAIAVAGYHPIVVAQGTQSEGPVLRCRVEKASFNNYTYFFPIVPTWGSMAISLDLVDSAGKTVWSKSFDGGGFTLNFFNGYNSAAKQSMNEILSEMVQELAGEQFEVALMSAQPSAIAKTPADPEAPPVAAEPPAGVPVGQ